MRNERRHSKFGNRRTVVDGISFDSQKEAVRYCELKLLEKAGEIHGLDRQVWFVLAPGVHIKGASRKSPALRYRADFAYIEKDGTAVVEDVKGYRDAIYRIKRHLMKSVHNIDILET